MSVRAGEERCQSWAEADGYSSSALRVDGYSPESPSLSRVVRLLAARADARHPRSSCRTKPLREPPAILMHNVVRGAAHQPLNRFCCAGTRVMARVCHEKTGYPPPSRPTRYCLRRLGRAVRIIIFLKRHGASASMRFDTIMSKRCHIAFEVPARGLRSLILKN